MAWRRAGFVTGPPPLVVTALTANPPGPVSTNTMVTWTAVASGGTGPFLYRFWIFNGTTWTIGQDWSPSNTWTWTPLAGGTYAVQVWVRNAGSLAAYDAWLGAGPFVVNGPKPLTVTSLTANQTFPIPAGTPVNWTASRQRRHWSLHLQILDLQRFDMDGWDRTGVHPAHLRGCPHRRALTIFQVWARNAGSSADYDAFRPDSVLTL